MFLYIKGFKIIIMKRNIVNKNSINVFKALSDETRLKIIEALLDGEKCVCDIIPYTGRKQSTVSLQLSKLEKLGVLESKRVGKNVYYRIKNPKIKKILKVAREVT